MKLSILGLMGWIAMSGPSTFAQQCGGVCGPGPGTPSYAVQACQMVNTFPAHIRYNTCVGANGCVWRQAQVVGVCSPGPGTPSYAVQACQMVNTFPSHIKYETCVGANGCVWQGACQ